MTALDATREAHLKAFENSYAVFVEAKRTLEVRMRAQAQIELQRLQTHASEDGNRAVLAGVPVSKLGDKSRAGMQTKNYNTIRAFLDLTKDTITETVEEILEAQEAKRFVWHDHPTDSTRMAVTVNVPGYSEIMLTAGMGPIDGWDHEAFLPWLRENSRELGAFITENQDADYARESSAA